MIILPPSVRQCSDENAYINGSPVAKYSILLNTPPTCIIFISPTPNPIFTLNYIPYSIVAFVNFS